MLCLNVQVAILFTMCFFHPFLLSLVQYFILSEGFDKVNKRICILLVRC